MSRQWTASDNVIIFILCSIIILLLLKPIQILIERFFIKEQYDFMKTIHESSLPESYITRAISPLYHNIQSDLKLSQFELYTLNPSGQQDHYFVEQFPNSNKNNFFEVAAATKDYLCHIDLADQSELGIIPEIVNIMKAKKAILVMPLVVQNLLIGLIFISFRENADKKDNREKLAKYQGSLSMAVHMAINLLYMKN